MFKCSADRHKNILYINFNGSPDELHLKMASDEIINKAKKLVVPFDIINDISSFHTTSVQGFIIIKELITELEKMGLARVVRITEPNELQAKKFSEAKDNANAKYKVRYAKNHDRAIKLLDDVDEWK